MQIDPTVVAIASVLVIITLLILLYTVVGKRLKAVTDNMDATQRFVMESVLEIIKAMNDSQDPNGNRILELIKDSIKESVKFVKGTTQGLTPEQERQLIVDSTMKILEELNKIESLRRFNLGELSQDFVEKLVDSLLFALNNPIKSTTISNL